MVLQDVQNLSSLTNTGCAAARSTFEVDEQSSRLLSRTHHVNDSIQHEREVVNLAIAVLCVLLAGVEIQTRASIDVVTHDDLLSCLVLGRDVVGGEGISTVFTSP